MNIFIRNNSHNGRKENRPDGPRLVRGQAALTAVIFFIGISLAIVLGFSGIALKQSSIAQSNTNASQSYYLAESGQEDAVYRIINSMSIDASETIMLGGSSAVTMILTVGNTREITSEGNVASNIRRLKTIVEFNTTGISFPYGAFVGNGGVEMSNTSNIVGSIYSNGNIEGTNSPVITGDAFAAGTSNISGDITIDGNARAHGILGSALVSVGGLASSTTLIDNASVGLSATADAFDDSTIGGNAYYKTSVSPDTTVGGLEIVIAVAPSDLPALPMPISDAQLDAWEVEAEAGEIGRASCRERV